MGVLDKLKSTLDWGKRGQFAYQVAIFLCSAGTWQVMKEIVVLAGVPLAWHIPIYLFSSAVVLVLLAALDSWWSNRKAVDARTPETAKVLEEVMLAGADFAVYDIMQARARELSHQLEELWHMWNNEGERLIHPLTSIDQLKDYLASNAQKLIDGRRDFLVLYSHHIVTMKSLVPDFKSGIIEAGYPSDLPYVDVRSALVNHAEELEIRSKKAWEKYGRPLDTLQ